MTPEEEKARLRVVVSKLSNVVAKMEGAGATVPASPTFSTDEIFVISTAVMMYPFKYDEEPDGRGQ